MKFSMIMLEDNNLCIHNHRINLLTRKHRLFEELNADTIKQLHMLMPSDTSADPLMGINMVKLTGRIDQSIEQLPVECRAGR